MEESRTIGRGEIFHFDMDYRMLGLQGFGEELYSVNISRIQRYGEKSHASASRILTGNPRLSQSLSETSVDCFLHF